MGSSCSSTECKCGPCGSKPKEIGEANDPECTAKVCHPDPMVEHPETQPVTNMQPDLPLDKDREDDDDEPFSRTHKPKEIGEATDPESTAKVCHPDPMFEHPETQPATNMQAELPLDKDREGDGDEPCGRTYSSRTFKPMVKVQIGNIPQKDDDDEEKHVMFSAQVSVKAALAGSEYDRTSIEVEVPSCGICGRSQYGDRWSCEKCKSFDMCDRCMIDRRNIIWGKKDFLVPMPPAELAIAIAKGYEDCKHHKSNYKLVRDEASIKMKATASEKVLENNLAAAKARRAKIEVMAR